MNIHTKILTLLLVTACLASNCLIVKAYAQAMEIIINKPSNTTVRVIRTDFGQGQLGIQEYADNPGEKLLPFSFSNIPLDRIEISASENIELGVELITAGPDDKPEALFINNGTDNINDAVPFGGQRKVFAMDSGGLLIKDKQTGDRTLRAVILLSLLKMSEIIFEYH
jgi:hypothetical protein